MKKKENTITELQVRFQNFVETLESIEPEKVDVNEIDRLIQMIDQIDEKCKQLLDPS